MSPAVRWLPAALLAAGAALTTGGTGRQHAVPLRAPLDTTIPRTIDGLVGRDLELSEAERQVAGMSNYLMRAFQPARPGDAAATTGFSLYIGYYDHQTQGRTIHSPKNCLPGAGWEALASQPHRIQTPAGLLTVNRYLLQRGRDQALVLYWYQGRGRTAWNEYAVKWDLLRDAALRGRSEEALVRIVVPLRGGDEQQALRLATRAAATVAPALDHALPRWR